MVNLTYLPYIVPTTGVVYGLFVVLVLYLFNRQERKRELDALYPVLEARPKPLFELYFGVLPFQFTYQSVNPYGGNILLLCTRIASFGYICGVSGLYGFIRKDFTKLFYFTNWNLIMISVYYGLSIHSSLIGIMYHTEITNGSFSDNSWLTVENPATTSEKSFWSPYVQRLGFCIQILFEVAGSTAMFVTVIAFTFLNPDFDFWNVSGHFVTSMSFLAEMAQNSMIVRWHHVALSLLWALIYLVYIWPAVGSGAVTNWPYPFLDTSGPGSFAWYFVLFFADALFFALWFYLSRAKYELVYRGCDTAKAVFAMHLRGVGSGSISSECPPHNPSTSSHSHGNSHDFSSHDVISSQESPVRRAASETGGPIIGGGLSRNFSKNGSLTGIEQGGSSRA